MMNLHTRSNQGAEQRPFRTIAHRGDVSNAPENTIAAFSTSNLYDPNVFNRVIEADFLKTSDGKYVVIHDTTVDRTTNGTGNVADLTLAEIKELDAGSWYDASFAGEKVPTMQELFEHCANNKITLWFDNKISNLDSDDAKAILDTWINAGNRLHNLIFFSSENNYSWAGTMRAENPSVRLGFFVNNNKSVSAVVSSVGAYSKPWIVSLEKSLALTYTTNISLLKETFDLVFVHTVVNGSEKTTATGKSPDGILSDIT